MNVLYDLDPFLCPEVRHEMEQRYYARANAAARLEELVHDPDFLFDPPSHVALWPDHGVVHVRDVAQQILRVLEEVHGVLIPARSAERFRRMQGYGVMVAYVHDIGTFDLSPFGRAIHPEFAAQEVMGSKFDDLVAVIWEQDCGGVAHHVADLARHGALEEPPETVLREMLAMGMCHSKTKVPIEILNAPEPLRARIWHAVATDLRSLYEERQMGRAGVAVSDLPRGNAFGWLVSSHPAARELASDVVDTVRALRAADALRQRGTVLKTSGNYEMMVDRRTGDALWALRLGQDQLFLLESDDPVVAGEANIASSALERDGSLRIAFHRGAFLEEGAVRRAAKNAARIVSDIQEDALVSFRRAETRDDLAHSDEVPILLEGADDNLEFTELVRQELLRLRPGLGNPVRSVPSLRNASAAEVARYLDGRAVDWDVERRQELIACVAAAGTRTENMDPAQAFEEVRLIQLAAGQALIETGSAAAFVYIPLGEGLQVRPLGGYAPFPVRPWMPLGNTGVIRGAARNADVVAEHAVELLMIPQDVFLKHWHHPYTPAEFRRLFEEASRPEAARSR